MKMNKGQPEILPSKHRVMSNVVEQCEGFQTIVIIINLLIITVGSDWMKGGLYHQRKLTQ